MRERIHTALCMVLVLTIFTGCKGMGALFKVAAVVAYVGVRAAVAAAASSHGSSSSESTRQDPDTCTCAPVNHGSTWCERQEGEDRCVLQCDAGWNFRDGLCVPSEQLISQAP
jgi:hypothetical protein